MFRALLELVITIILVVAARAVLASFMKGMSGAAANAFKQPAQESRSEGPVGAQPRAGKVPPGPATGSELHKDPVCGIYVVESTPFHRQAGGTAYYYCSEACLKEHKL